MHIFYFHLFIKGNLSNIFLHSVNYTLEIEYFEALVILSVGEIGTDYHEIYLFPHVSLFSS